MRRPIPVLLGLALGALALLTACGDGDDGTPMEPDDETGFQRQLTLNEFLNVLQSGPTRVEIELGPNGVVASEVEVRTEAALDDEEEIQSRVTAIDAGAASGTLTLDLAGLEVNFTEATNFSAENSDELDFDSFVAAVQERLPEDVAIRARRDPLEEPQDPDDTGFVATDIRLDDESDEGELEIAIDAANLEIENQPPPNAVLRVLDTAIEIRLDEELTELVIQNETVGDRIEFEGIIDAANSATSTITLLDGTQVRIESDTRIEADDPDELGSLAEVIDALNANDFVEADGQGVAITANPLVIAAVRLELEIEDDVTDMPDGFQFDDRVTDVDGDALTFTLEGGRTLVLTHLGLEPRGDFDSFPEVVEAFDAGDPIRAIGGGVEALTDSGLEFRVVTVRFELDQ